MTLIQQGLAITSTWLSLVKWKLYYNIALGLQHGNDCIMSFVQVDSKTMLENVHEFWFEGWNLKQFFRYDNEIDFPIFFSSQF